MIIRKKQIENHVLADIFPMLDPESFDLLVEDIKSNGLIQKIYLYENKILDGRNRYRACLKAGVTPEFEEFKGRDALSFVVSANLHRRHLTTDQKLKVVENLRAKGWSIEQITKELRIAKLTIYRHEKRELEQNSNGAAAPKISPGQWIEPKIIHVRDSSLSEQDLKDNEEVNQELKKFREQEGMRLLKKFKRKYYDLEMFSNILNRQRDLKAR